MLWLSACEYGKKYCKELFKYKHFSLQVKWKKSDVKFEDRFDKYLDPSFFQHRVCIVLRQRYNMSLYNGCISLDVMQFLDYIFSRCSGTIKKGGMTVF